MGQSMPQGQVHTIRETYPAALNKEGIATLAGNERDVQREQFGADSQNAVSRWHAIIAVS
jgi:hypothetical protein